MADQTELRLDGGNVAEVVRVGDTVRRLAGPWTPAVQELLAYLEDVGFAYSPRPLGLDSEGREVLTYIDGETVGSGHRWPAWAWADATLQQAGRLLRHYHDTVDGYRPKGERTWRFVADHLDDTEVICHNDLAPYNIVWKDGAIVGIIDWDLASPGSPRSDLAFTAWSFCPIHTPPHAESLGAPTDVVRRLKVLCDSYGFQRTEGFLGAIRERMQTSIEGIKVKAAAGEDAFQRLVAGGHLARMEQDAQWLDLHEHQWERDLANL